MFGIKIQPRPCSKWRTGSRDFLVRLFRVKLYSSCRTADIHGFQSGKRRIGDAAHRDILRIGATVGGTGFYDIVARVYDKGMRVVGLCRFVIDQSAVRPAKCIGIVRPNVQDIDFNAAMVRYSLPGVAVTST